MVNLTWQEARDFCKWAGGDLPTEAQWEKAARGRHGQIYPWGDVFDPSRLRCSKGTYGDANSTAPVGSYPEGASPYGCLDMAGNVCQFCLDWYAPMTTEKEVRNPTGPEVGTDHMMKGGSWFTWQPTEFDSAGRHFHMSPDKFNIATGFRLVCPQ